MIYPPAGTNRIEGFDSLLSPPNVRSLSTFPFASIQSTSQSGGTEELDRSSEYESPVRHLLNGVQFFDVRAAVAFIPKFVPVSVQPYYPAIICIAEMWAVLVA